jgi:hypothetical protein
MILAQNPERRAANARMNRRAGRRRQNEGQARLAGGKRRDDAQPRREIAPQGRQVGTGNVSGSPLRNASTNAVAHIVMAASKKGSNGRSLLSSNTTVSHQPLGMALLLVDGVPQTPRPSQLNLPKVSARRPKFSPANDPRNRQRRPKGREETQGAVLARLVGPCQGVYLPAMGCGAGPKRC